MTVSTIQTKKLLIFLLSSGNINKYEFLTVKDVLPEKAPALKIFEDSPLEKELKAQTSGGEKQYLNQTKFLNLIKMKKKLKEVVLSQIQPTGTFYKYCNINKFDRNYFYSKINK